jgi:hypothetical protein
MRLDHHVGLLDHQVGEADDQIDDHVVDLQGLGVALQVHSGRLQVAHHAAQPEQVGTLPVGAHAVGAVVEQRQ